MVLKNPDKYQLGKTIIYFVRHGDRIHIPGTPEPHDFSLSAKGKKQAKDVAKKFAKIIISPKYSIEKCNLYSIWYRRRIIIIKNIRTQESNI
jgi:hypothetical protein